MIRLIASDLDDTLLGSDKKISPENIAAIKKAQEAGVQFVAATGREYRDTDYVINGTGLECDRIVASGADIRDKDNKSIRMYFTEWKDLEAMHRIAVQNGVHVLYFGEHDDYVIGTEADKDRLLIDEIRLFFWDASDEEIRQTDFYKMRMKEIICLDSEKEFEKQKIYIYKTLAFLKEVEKLAEMKRQIDELGTLCTASSLSTCIELTDIKVQKGPILKEYAEERGISMEEVMVIGDSPNDRSMFDMGFGASVAVSNGHEEIKAIATHITKSNDEHGVAYVIEKILAGRLDDLKNDRGAKG